MDIPIEQYGISGVMLVSGIILGAIAWNNVQRDVRSLEKKDSEQDDRFAQQDLKISDVIRWSHEHEKEAAIARENLLKELAKLEGSTLVIGEQFKQIMSALTEIKDRLTDLENNKNGRS